MTHPSPSLAAHFAGLRTVLHAQAGEVRPHAGALDGMLLALLSLILGQLERLARAWHPAPGQDDHAQGVPPDHSPMAWLPPNLRYLFGPRRNRGMRPHARTMPIAPPRAARAPPPRAPTHAPHVTRPNTRPHLAPSAP